MLTNDALVMKFITLRVDLNYNLSVYINKDNIVSVNLCCFPLVQNCNFDNKNKLIKHAFIHNRECIGQLSCS